MPTVYLHIGAPKTATSALQALLAQNAEALLASGVLYPQTCRHGDAHHVLICDLIERHQGHPLPDFWYGDYPRGRAWQALREELARQVDAIHAAVVSSELFFGQTTHLDAILADIARELAGYPVRVVVYLRRQDRMYSSFYNQDVKGVRQWAEDAYSFYATHQLFQLDYYSLLRRWGEAFGPANILLRPYEPAQWVDGDIGRDFCAALGLPALPAAAAESNEGLGVTRLCIKRYLNRVGFDKGANEEVLAILAQLVPEPPARDVIYVNRHAYGNYRRQWQRVNRRLAEELLAGRRLFRERIPEPAAVEPYRVDPDRLWQFVPALLDHFGAGHSPQYRSLFARAALLLLIEHRLLERLEPPAREALFSWTVDPEA